MAHSPQDENKVRAPRVSLFHGEPIRFYLNDRCITAIVHQLSSTGGLAESMKHIAPGTLAEMNMEVDSAEVSGGVEFLKVQKEGTTSLLPFRFVGLDTQNRERLETILEALRKRLR